MPIAAGCISCLGKSAYYMVMNMTRILLINDTPMHTGRLAESLTAAGYLVVAEVQAAIDLPRAVEQYRPDVIIVDAESPSRDALEQLCAVNAAAPRPIVMFTEERDQTVIRAAVQAGVTAYVVDGLSPSRLQPLLDVAITRFQEEQQLRSKLESTERQLAERKLVEKAKGILIDKRGMTEEAAYQLLRKTAMERGQRIGEVARNLIDASKLLG
ncbi:MAG: response regulator [Proteobacteria bacterium]|nr:response regulator [Pseudomonadota bacterium]